MITLKPHQEKAVNRLRSGNILCGDVGSGKTIVALWWYLYVACRGTPEGLMGDPKDLYIFTTAKKRDSLDWESEAQLLNLMDGPSGTKVVVDSYNNMAKYKDIKGAVVICDEQRLVGKGMWSKTFIEIAKSNEWLLLSATPSDVWMDLVPVFLANGFYKNRTEFMREHVVYSYFGKYPKIERYIGVNKLKHLRNSIMVDMPFEKHTVRHFTSVPCEFDKDTMRKVVKERWHVYEDRPLKDVGEMFHVMRKVANSDPSRTKALTEIMKKHPKVIVFYSFDYELEILRGLGEELTTSSGEPTTTPEISTLISGAQPTGSFSVAEWNGHKHEEIPKTDSWIYLVQYNAGSEGWNCIETDTTVFYSLTYSYKMFKQAQGRIDRLNTPFTDMNYYIFKSPSMIDSYIWKALSEKKSFHESGIRSLSV